MCSRSYKVADFLGDQRNQKPSAKHVPLKKQPNHPLNYLASLIQRNNECCVDRIKSLILAQMLAQLPEVIAPMLEACILVETGTGWG
jgi:hypothetical protein